MCEWVVAGCRFEAAEQEWGLVSQPHGLLRAVQEHLHQLTEKLSCLCEGEKLQSGAESVLSRVEECGLVLARVAAYRDNYEHISRAGSSLLKSTLRLAAALLDSVSTTAYNPRGLGLGARG